MLATTTTTQSPKRVVPIVVLRVPGMWTSIQELAERLPGGCRYEDDWLHFDDCPPMELKLQEADRQFPSIFCSVCRRPLPSKAQREIATYRHNAVLAAAGGSIIRAQHILSGAAALIKAGGMGVFIDNCGLAHADSDWLELAENRCHPRALLFAFVNFLRSRTSTIRTRGMHVLGQPDGIVQPSSDMEALEYYAISVCAMSPTMAEGQVITDERGKNYRLQAEADRELSADHPMRNPFGYWRLIPTK